MKKMRVILFLIAAGTLLAQTGNPVNDALIQGTQMRLQIERARIAQRDLELRQAADRREQQRHDAEMKRLQEPRVSNSQPSRPSSAPALTPSTLAAIARLQVTYPDFEKLLPAINIVAEGFKVDYEKVTQEEYLECLYVIVKHASFTHVAREKLLGEAPAVAVNPFNP